MILSALGEEVFDGFDVARTAVRAIGCVGFVDAEEMVVEWSVAGVELSDDGCLGAGK